jgi:hypothetical protein
MFKNKLHFKALIQKPPPLKFCQPWCCISLYIPSFHLVYTQNKPVTCVLRETHVLWGPSCTGQIYLVYTFTPMQKGKVMVQFYNETWLQEKVLVCNTGHHLHTTICSQTNSFLIRVGCHFSPCNLLMGLHQYMFPFQVSLLRND